VTVGLLPLSESYTRVLEAILLLFIVTCAIYKVFKNQHTDIVSLFRQDWYVIVK